MKEELLHYTWRTKNFTFYDLKTTENESVEIINFGFYNLNAGPDFLEGSIEIDGTTWAGHIEMHVFSSDWNRHKHSIDAAYDNVILHVVWEEDEVIYRRDGSIIPCIELKGKISKDLIEGYSILLSRNNGIPCSSQLKGDDHSKFYLQLHRLFVERLENKCYPISLDLESNTNDWQQVLFICLAKSMGIQVNKEGMEALARSIPVRLISKHKKDRFQLEALFYGQAAMLHSEWNEKYPQDLKNEYLFLKEKYQLKSISGKQWKLARMRPSSFPTIRISQLVHLFYKHADLLSKLIYSNTVQELYSLLEADASEYWDDHYLFDKPSHFKRKVIGDQTKKNIIINGLVPFLFAYGQYHSREDWVEKSISLMEQLDKEQNKIIREWNKWNISPENSLQSQALIHLYKNYCVKNKCLSCAYGNQLLTSIGNCNVIREPLIWV